MKSKLLLFMAIFALAFLACSDDDEGSGDTEMTVMLSVYYEMANSDYEYPDSNSKVYVFRGTDFTNSKYEYKGEGKFYNKENGNWSDAKQTLSMGNSVVIPIKCTYDCTIAVESAHYDGSFAIKTKSLNDKDKTVKVVFSAQN
jgi:hypothetical protein